MYKVNNPTGTVKFHKKYYYPIKDGVKTQTLRLARKRLDVQEGDIVTAIFPGTNETLEIQINKIGYKQFKSINREDALHEGFPEVSDLKNELIKIYPSINQFDRLYYYQFEVVSNRPNFNVVEGENSSFWDNYEEFIQLWNEGKLLVKQIRENLDLSPSKYNQYRDKAMSEGRLDIDIRSPQNSVKRGHHTRTALTRKKGV